MEKTTLFMIPCFAGAPWALSQFSALSDYALKTMELPHDLKDIETFADFVEQQVRGHDNYALVGDSFGAVISLALATRRPEGLKALIISGGFAKNPITSPFLKVLSRLAPYFPGPFYRELTLRIHAFNLRSRFDKGAEIPWSQGQTRKFFKSWTPHHAYVNRVRAVEKADYVARLRDISVPTLILTPEEDNLIGADASKLMLKNIPNSIEEVLPATGHMFRFSHPGLFSEHVKRFLRTNNIKG
jgi:pimeloyl-ACP methyl ester carboxylesterase